MTYLEKVYQTVTNMVEDVEVMLECDYTPYYWKDDDGKEVNLRKYLEDYFEFSSFIYEYSIEEVTCLDSFSYSCGVVSIAFTTIGNELGHIVIEWEEK